MSMSIAMSNLLSGSESWVSNMTMGVEKWAQNEVSEFSTLLYFAIKKSMQLRAVVKWGRRNAIKQDQDVPATGSKMPRLPRTTNKILFFSRTWKYFVDALASLDFKLSVGQSVIDIFQIINDNQ